MNTTPPDDSTGLEQSDPPATRREPSKASLPRWFRWWPVAIALYALACEFVWWKWKGAGLAVFATVVQPPMVLGAVLLAIQQISIGRAQISTELESAAQDRADQLELYRWTELQRAVAGFYQCVSDLRLRHPHVTESWWTAVKLSVAAAIVTGFGLGRKGGRAGRIAPLFLVLLHNSLSEFDQDVAKWSDSLYELEGHERAIRMHDVDGVFTDSVERLHTQAETLVDALPKPEAATDKFIVWAFGGARKAVDVRPLLHEMQVELDRMDAIATTEVNRLLNRKTVDASFGSGAQR